MTPALPPITRHQLRDTHRLVPSRYPPVGILDAVVASSDLDQMLELEGWTNDRISAELGVLRTIPPDEWVIGRPQASVIMAAFCHPQPGGSRFNGGDRGAWYAALDLATAHAEVIFHRSRELAEIGVFETRVEMRQYLADFNAAFHDLCGDDPAFAPTLDPDRYDASQALARALLRAGSNGIVYRSVRRAGGECVACFRPVLVSRVRPAAHFEYRWEGSPVPAVRRLEIDLPTA